MKHVELIEESLRNDGVTVRAPFTAELRRGLEATIESDGGGVLVLAPKQGDKLHYNGFREATKTGAKPREWHVELTELSVRDEEMIFGALLAHFHDECQIGPWNDKRNAIKLAVHRATRDGAAADYAALIVELEEAFLAMKCPAGGVVIRELEESSDAPRTWLVQLHASRAPRLDNVTERAWDRAVWPTDEETASMLSVTKVRLQPGRHAPNQRTYVQVVEEERA